MFVLLRNIIRKTRVFFRKNFIKPDIILIYTMGKVGSSTVYKTISSNLPKSLFFQAHFLSDYAFNEFLPKTRHFNSNLNKAKQIFNALKIYNKSRLKIITLIRDPLARDISNVFENPEEFIGEKEFNKFTVEQLFEIFNKKENHWIALNWFDEEFQRYTGIDVFQHSFDKEKNYTIYNFNDYDLLILKMENLSENGPEALSLFLNKQINDLTNSNLGEQKQSKDFAKEFKKKYRPTSQEIEKVYKSKVVKHFYSNAEIQHFIQKWRPN